ncbi:MAG: ACP S-malonyltransferase [Chlorobi bacterium]|nr:ACP S-malonyltransferase [Chlorobiota bacterium]
MKTAFIFPAFVSEYLGTEDQILRSFSGNFQQKLDTLTRITGDDYQNLSLDDPDFTHDELRSQIISYVFSCSLSDELTNRGLKPVAVAGYSMGLYAALYGSRVFEFEHGLQLVEEAYAVSRSVIKGIDCGMGSVIGLTRDEIETLIIDFKISAEIANTNSKYSHLITGKLKDVEHLLDKARETGAMNVSFLPVKTPYHSRLLKETQVEFGQFIKNHIPLKEPDYPVISCIDQKVLKTSEAIANELVRNLHESLNWKKTFEKLLNMGISQFVECGAGKSLQKIGRFMDGEFIIYPMNKLHRIVD